MTSRGANESRSPRKRPRKRPPLIIPAASDAAAQVVVAGLDGQSALADWKPAGVVKGTDEYVAGLRHQSDKYLADLEVKADMAWKHERILWWLFVLVFI